jgi:tRNA 2-thiouridine synthesizing protein A
VTPALELDCRGMLCPLPVITLARRIADVPVGETITVLADDPAAATDIPAWCRMQSQELVEAVADRYTIRRLH